MPRVVIGGHADHGVCKFGFARQLSFREAGHVDYRGREGGRSVEDGFGAGRELRSFYWVRIWLAVGSSRNNEEVIASIEMKTRAWVSIARTCWRNIRG